MNGKSLLRFLTAITITLTGTAHSQVLRPGVGASSPNSQNQNLDTMQQIRLLEEQRQRDAQMQQRIPARDQAAAQAQVAKFREAIKHRKHRFADFDQVVIHSKTPVTPAMLEMMAQSPYAADIAYYLGKHPEQSGAIAQMQPAEAGLAVRQLEATIAAENAGRK
jgi:hypothetical protein